MGTRSFPHDSVDGDRPLDTAQWARVWQTLATDGVVLGHGDLLAVEATAPETMAVQVRPGRAFVRGRWFEVHDTPETVTLATANATNPRIDRIVVRRDLTARTVTLGVVAGTAASSPTVPALTQSESGIWEVPVGQVYVRANATSIRGSDQADGQGYVHIDDRVWGSSPFTLTTTVELAVATTTVNLTPPPGGRHLHLTARCPTVGDNVEAILRLNGYTGASDYLRDTTSVNGSTITPLTGADNSLHIGLFGALWGNFTLTIPNYSRPDTNRAGVQGHSSGGWAGGQSRRGWIGGRMVVAGEVVTQVRVIAAGSQFQAGSVFTLRAER